MSKYHLKFTTKFKKDFKKVSRDAKKLAEVKVVFGILMDFGAEGIPLSMKPHQLKGRYYEFWECHVRPDLLLIWFQIDEPTNTIYFERIGSHSELFD